MTDQTDDTTSNDETTSNTGSINTGDSDTGDLPGNPEKDPQDWVTGDEKMTGPQASYLRTLSQEAGVDFDETMTKAEASQRIDELQAETGRGDTAG